MPSSQVPKPTVIVLDRPRRVVVKEAAPPPPQTRGGDANSPGAQARNKVVNRLKRLHPMD
jgi:hypothetical protein